MIVVKLLWTIENVIDVGKCLRKLPLGWPPVRG